MLHFRLQVEATVAADSSKDIEEYLDFLESLAASTNPGLKALNMVCFKRHDFDDILYNIRQLVPREIQQAKDIIKNAENIIKNAREQAEKITAEAETKQHDLIKESEVVQQAEAERTRIIEEAQEEAQVIQNDALKYIDNTLYKNSQELNNLAVAIKDNVLVMVNHSLASINESRNRLARALSSVDNANHNGSNQHTE